jgi:hypothetical protein
MLRNLLGAAAVMAYIAAMPALAQAQTPAPSTPPAAAPAAMAPTTTAMHHHHHHHHAAAPAAK